MSRLFAPNTGPVDTGAVTNNRSSWRTVVEELAVGDEHL